MSFETEFPRDNQKRGKKTELSFEPLSEGLGFHPFSDGLPYAPTSKAPTAKASSQTRDLGMGAGAVSAGLPSFASPKIQAPRVSVPVAQPQPYQPQAPMVQPQRTSAALSTMVTSPSLAAELEPSFGFGYMVKRVFAYLFDSLFNVGLCVGALSAALWRQDMNPEVLLTPGIVLVSVLFLAVFNWAITTAQEVAFGTSIGKRLFGLAIQGSTSAIFLRAFFFLPSICFGGIGILWAVFDRRRRCWHDLVVDLQPIEIARL